MKVILPRKLLISISFFEIRQRRRGYFSSSREFPLNSSIYSESPYRSGDGGMVFICHLRNDVPLVKGMLKKFCAIIQDEEKCRGGVDELQCSSSVLCNCFSSKPFGTKSFLLGPLNRSGCHFINSFI